MIVAVQLDGIAVVFNGHFIVLSGKGLVAKSAYKREREEPSEKECIQPCYMSHTSSCMYSLFEFVCRLVVAHGGSERCGG